MSAKNLFYPFLFAGLLFVLSCTERLLPQGDPAPLVAERAILECQMADLTTMQGETLSLKIARLWIDFEARILFRAYQFPNGRVVRQPYSLRESDLDGAFKAELASAGFPFEGFRAYRFHYRERDEMLFFKPDPLQGFIVTIESRPDGEALAKYGGEKSRFTCIQISNLHVVPHEELIPADPPVPPPPPPPVPMGCADGSVEQVFGTKMVGCSGQIRFPDRAQLCSAGWTVCTAAQWVERFASKIPEFHYWTNDDLNYTGFGSNNCAALLAGGSHCGTNTLMRVCTPALTDPLNNRCNWINCGLEITSENHYFGGCSGNATAGSLCCR